MTIIDKNNIKTYLQKLLELKHPAYYTIIGTKHEKGINGYELNKSKAFEFYLQGANLNYIRGVEYVIECYEKEIGCKYDKNQIIYWKKKLIDIYSNLMTFNCNIAYNIASLYLYLGDYINYNKYLITAYHRAIKESKDSFKEKIKKQYDNTVFEIMISQNDYRIKDEQRFVFDALNGQINRHLIKIISEYYVLS